MPCGTIESHKKHPMSPKRAISWILQNSLVLNSNKETETNMHGPWL